MAAQAWARAAELADGADAADSLLRAAELCRSDDARQALEWLERAARHDPGAPSVCVALAASRETCGDLAGALVGAAAFGLLYERLQGPFGLPPLSPRARQGRGSLPHDPITPKLPS